MVDPFLFVLRFLFDFWWFFLIVMLIQIFWEKFTSNQKKIFRKNLTWSFFEIKFPSGILKNPRAMEEVWNSLHAIAPEIERDLNWWNLNIKGYSPKFYTLIFIAHNGKLSFYLRYPSELKDFIKSRFYSQYPDIQFIDVNDPLDFLPPAVPNTLLDGESFDIRPIKEDSYPIKTFTFLEYLPKEQQIDPLTTFIEAATNLSEKEWLISQLFITPTTADNENVGNKWVERGQKLINKLIGKGEKKEFTAWDEIKQFAINLLLAFFRSPVWDKGEEKPKEEFNIQKLTPGERQIIEMVQQKISKLGFWCNWRISYLAYGDIFSTKKYVAFTLINGILKNFSTENLNSLFGYSLTTPLTSTFLSSKRLFVIKRNILPGIKSYSPPSPARMYIDKIKKVKVDKGFILNSEELATIFHPPMEFVPETGIEKEKGKELPPSFDLPFIEE